jgi:putative colanic acid biosynthesis acetyltransferase WcaB
MNIISYLSQDFSNNKHNTKGKIITFFFRIGNYAVQKYWLKIIFTPYLIFYKLVFEWIFCIEIPYNTKIDAGLMIYHGFGIVINKQSIIGKNVKIRQNTTIGNSKNGGKSPIIEDNVDIGANCVIIGEIIIGNHSIIGAGSVINKSIPPFSVVVGNPFRIVKKLQY